MTGAIRTFRIDVSDLVLADLTERLRRTRWPDAEVVTDWSQGAPLKWIQDICQYWTDTYNWRERETQLNRFDHHAGAALDGAELHEYHALERDGKGWPFRRLRAARVVCAGGPGVLPDFAIALIR